MYIGQQIDSHESLENEYKEFCIKNNIFDYYTINELNHIIETGILPYSFNNMIYDNLQTYFDVYIPKYASAYHNSNVKNGNIQIGINDYSEVTGIPFIGDISKGDIHKMIDSSKSKYLSCKVFTKVKITKLKYNKNILEDTTDHYIEKIKKQNYVHKMIHENYYKERSFWVKEVLKYSVKLSNIINHPDTKTKFYEWVKFQSDCKIIKECLTCTPEFIESIKNKRKYITVKTHIIYWIAKFKDTHMEKLQKSKPEVPNLTKFSNSSVYLITHLTDMRQKFLNNNHHLNYFKIDIQFVHNSNNDVISYKKKNRTQQFISYRKQREIGPYCITTT